jgi:competence protein ComEC
METVRSSPGLEDVWQTHFVVDGGEKDHNAPKEMCASVEGDDPRQVRFIKLSAERDGTFTVSNNRNGFSKRYPARAR